MSAINGSPPSACARIAGADWTPAAPLKLAWRDGRRTLLLARPGVQDGNDDALKVGTRLAVSYPAVMVARSGRARIEDVRELAMGMPHVTVGHGPRGNDVYQVGGKSFVFFRCGGAGSASSPGRSWPRSFIDWPPAEPVYWVGGMSQPPFVQAMNSLVVLQACDEHCEVAYATGRAGDVYLCHPFLVHAAQANHGSRPRFLGQPAIPAIPAIPASYPYRLDARTRSARPSNSASSRACGE